MDLMVSVNDDGSGFGEVLRIASPQAAADPRLAELAFDVEVSDGLRLRETEGGFEAVDAAGDVVLRERWRPGDWQLGALPLEICGGLNRRGDLAAVGSPQNR